MEVRLTVNSSAPLTTAATAGASSLPRGRGGSPSAWHMGPGLSSVEVHDGDGGEGGKAAASLDPSADTAAIEAASSMNLSVAMRVGALPVVDPSGE